MSSGSADTGAPSIQSQIQANYFGMKRHRTGFIEAKHDGGGGDNSSYKMCKVPLKLSPSTNQHPTFYRPGALPVTPPTVGALKRKITTFHRTAHAEFTWKSSICVLTTEGSWSPSGGLPSLSSSPLMPVPQERQTSWPFQDNLTLLPPSAIFLRWTWVNQYQNVSSGFYWSEEWRQSFALTLWLGDRKGIRPVKTECWFVGDVLTAALHRGVYSI